MSSPFDWLTGDLHQLEQAGLLRARREVTPLAGGRCRSEGRELWNFASNDYLGLADDPRLIEAASAAARELGVGARASALVTGRTPWHARLEDRLARFKQAEAAILFPTGYAANVGVITSLAGPGGAVYCDRWNHSSLIDGCRLSRARFRVYPHLDLDALRRALQRDADRPRRLVVTDSLFSMDGDAAPLADLCQLAEEQDALLLVDEAHATGVFGDRGTGWLEHCRDQSPSTAGWSRVIPVGTLSKACGAQGGFVTGPRALCDWLWNSARMQIYSTALTVPACAAAIAALDIIEQEPQRRVWLREASQHVRDALRSAGWIVPAGVIGPIIPVVLGDPAMTMMLAEGLRERGVLVAAIRPPTVPRNSSRLRLSLSSAHGETGVRALLEAFAELRARAEN